MSLKQTIQIAFVLAIAGLVIGMLYKQAPTSPQIPSQNRQPTWQAQGVSVWQTTLPEQTHQVIFAQQAAHWNNTQLTQLTLPEGIIIESQNHYLFKAQYAQVQRNTLTLEKQVHIQRIQPMKPPLEIYARQLRYDIHAQRIDGNDGVKIVHQQGWTTGRQLIFWPEQHRLILNQDIHTYYEP
jgi:LPS export ABC transporter protein LptC